MPGIKGDDAMLRRRVLADLVKSRSRGGMRSSPQSGTSAKGRRISDVAQARKAPK